MSDYDARAMVAAYARSSDRTTRAAAATRLDELLDDEQE